MVMSKTAGLYKEKLWRRESVKLGVASLRKRRRAKLIEYLGGSCAKCGYNRCLAALEIHHRDPSKKEFKFDAAALTKKWELLLAEANKCDLLCANCHREEHYMES